MAYWGAVIGAVANVADSWISSSSAHKANRTNIQLAREQREWEERMANTAIVRRKRDFEAAGFNPVLAATGPGAATPSVAAPTVEPTYRGGAGKGIADSLLLNAQIRNMQANTASQAADARIKNVEADIREGLASSEKEARLNRNIEQVEWDDLKTQLLRSQNISSAAEAKRMEETLDAIIQQVKQDAARGKLDLEALSNIAQVHGIEAGKLSWILKLITSFIISERARD